LTAAGSSRLRALVRARRAKVVAGNVADTARKARELVMRLGRKAKSRATIFKGKTRKNAGKATGNSRLRARGTIGEMIGRLKLTGAKAKSR
jgi:uncharacterized protein YjbJ (UPF0337 family)